MNTFFTNNRCSLVLRGAINLLILSAIVSTFFGIPLKTYAQTLSAQSTITQDFNDFCTFYYKKHQSGQANQNSQSCQQMSASFSSLLILDSPNGYIFWPTQLSLHSLTQKGLLMDTRMLTRIQTPQAFVNTIRTNLDLQAFISGTGNINKNIPQDPDFLPTLWDYTSNKVNQTITPTCTSISLSYYYSDTWPFVGPEILKATSQQIMHTTDTQTTYHKLITDGHCSLATLAANMSSVATLTSTYQAGKKYSIGTPPSTYQLEKNILTTVQSHFQGSQIYDVSTGLAWIISQNNPTLVNDWVSFAILTNPHALVSDNTIPSNNNLAITS